MDKNNMKIGKCYAVLKDVIFGRETGFWVFAGVLLARLGVTEVGNVCPICGSFFESGKGVYNHLLWGGCRYKFIDICMDAHGISERVARVVSVKKSIISSNGKKMFKIYVSRVGNILCLYKDVKCVAENMIKIINDIKSG
jgi:hypothetical protein